MDYSLLLVIETISVNQEIKHSLEHMTANMMHHNSNDDNMFESVIDYDGYWNVNRNIYSPCESMAVPSTKVVHIGIIDYL